MQFYEFRCPKCDQHYTIRCSFAEYDAMMKENPPKCEDDGEELIRNYSPQMRWNASGGTRGKVL